VVCGEEHARTRSRDGLWKLKLTRPKLQVDTDSREGVDLDTWFPEALAFLRIKETGSREFFMKVK